MPARLEPIAGLAGLIRPYVPVLRALQFSRIPFALGGGAAYSLYAGLFRDTNDLDLYILPANRQLTVAIVTDVGYEDYARQAPYETHWIYRGWKDGRILDVIWQMPNHRATVDQAWFARANEVEVESLRLKVIPVEELVFAKLYVFQRDRCDWPDLLGAIYQQGQSMNWEHLLARVADDRRLLASLVNLFSWLCPERARTLPDWLWPRLDLAPPTRGPACDQPGSRARILDTRPWFPPLQMKGD